MSALAAPALAIANYVRNREGAVSSAEILERFWISQSTLKRRRPELARLGVVFVADGNRSFFAVRELVEQLPGNYQPHGRFSTAQPCTHEKAALNSAGHLKIPCEPLLQGCTPDKGPPCG